MQPLEGIRVVELAQGIAGPYAGKLLAGYGADVIKVEPPQGDRARYLGPWNGVENVETGAVHLHLNTNKRSVIGASTDEHVMKLIAGADIVIQSEPTPDPSELRKKYPSLVVVSVTSFGLTGPLAQYLGEEIVHYAYGGPMSASGDPTRAPLKMGGDLGQYQCGSMAAVSALSALTIAEKSGQGVHVDLSNIETQITSIDRRAAYLVYASYRNEHVAREGGYRVSPFPMGCRPALDGHVQVSTLVNWIPRMLATIEDPEMEELFDDPMWLFNEEHPELADTRLVMWTLTKNRQQAMEEAQARSWPVTAVNKPVDLLKDPHFKQREFFETTEHPVAGEIMLPGAPIRIEDGWKTLRPAPLLGEHTAELLKEPSRKKKSRKNSEQELPLQDIRVLDMTVVWSGPYVTQILGDLGADVIRVDNPWIFPTVTRGLLPRPPAEIIKDVGGIFGGYPDADPGNRPWNRVGLFNAHARNKKSITIDLRKDLGRKAFFELVGKCDVMIENNSVDLLDHLEIGWEEIQAVNPRLILVRMPAVGIEGPYRDYLGFGVNFEALCGLGSLRGYADSDLSENDGVYHMDAASGSAGVLATLLALRKRDQTGIGEMIELSQCENMLNHIGEFLIDAARTGSEHEAIGNRHRVHAPQGCYQCEGLDKWIVLSITTDKQWHSLCALMDTADLANDKELQSVEGRQKRHDELDDRIGAWVQTLDAVDLFHKLQSNGIPAAPVLNELEALDDSHLRARGMFAPNGNLDTGTHDYPTHVWRWDGPDMAYGPLPVLGENNKDIYQNLLGMNEEEYLAMELDGHISEDYLMPDGSAQ